MMVKRYNIVINKETSTIKHLFYCEKLTFDFSSGLLSQ